MGSSPVYTGRAKTMAGSVDICNGREVITGIENGLTTINLQLKLL